MAERGLRFPLTSSWDGKGVRQGRRDLERFRRDSGRIFDRAGGESGRRYGMRLSKSLGGGMSASTGIVSRGAQAMGGALAGIGLIKLGTDAVQMAATFDKTMRQTAQVAKVPQRQMAELREVALDMGAKTSFSARQAGEAMLELGKGGLTFAEQKAGALSSTLTLAAAGGLELGEAAGFVVQGLRSFGLRANQSAKVAAALAGAANASTSSVEDMGLALSQTAAGARNAGLSIQETTGVLAAFANNGVKGSDAGTSLKTMLQRLVPETEKAKRKMQALNLSFVDSRGAILPITEIAQRLQDRLKGLSQEQRTAALQIIFGSDATRAATILMREGERGLAKYIKATSDRAAAEKLAKTNTEGAAGAFERLQGAIETMQIRLGTALLPMLADAATTIADRVIPAVERWIKTFRDDLGPHLGRMKQAWEDNKGAITAFVTSLGRSESGMHSSRSAAASLADSVVTLTNALGTTAEKGNDAGNFLDKFADQLTDSDGAVGRFGESFRRLVTGWAGMRPPTEEFRNLSAATNSATTAADRHAAAVRGEKQAIDALKNALQAEEASELDVRQAKLNVATAQQRLTGLVKGGRRGSLEYRQAQIDLRRAQLDLKAKTDEYKTAQAKANAATSGAMRASSQARPQVSRLGEAARAGGTKAGNARIPWRKLGEDVDRTYREIHNKTAHITAKFGWQGLEVFRVGPKGQTRLAFAEGGRLPGYGGGDRIPIMAEGGEAIVPKDKARRPEFKAWAGDMGIPGYQRGGRIPSFRMRGQRGMVDALGDWDLQVDKVMGAAARAFGNTLNASMGALGGGSGPGGWRWQMAALRSAFPGLQLISGYRPGAITATGNRSYHAMGRAVDVPPRMDVFNWIRAMFGQRTRELIFTPAGGRQVWNGRPHVYTGITARNHVGHIHWAYDKGGWLMPGTTVATNRTNKPERVLPPGPVIDERRLARLMAEELVGAMARAGLGSVYLDGTKVDRRLATASQWNSRRA